MADILMNFLRAQAAGVADDQADIQQSLQALIQEHLEEVLDANQLPPPDQPVGLEKCRSRAQILSDGLRQDGDVLAAELLQAALRLSRTSIGADTDYISDFLERIMGVIIGKGGGGNDEFKKYLEGILLELSRRRWVDAKQPPSPASTVESQPLTAATEPCVTLYVKESTIPLQFDEILPTFWGTRLDTDCHSCQQQIKDEPPIRTIARVEPSSATVLGIHVRVINRHFSCLRAINAPWIPVSHVWDASIRRANDFKTNDDEAASALLMALTALLDASVDAYGPEVEFWHDYFSVPQWERRIQESLLLRIPAIYHDAQEILVQMPDLPGPYIMMLLSQGPSRFSASMALRFMPMLHALCSSQWMQRMWVLVEFSLCRSACVMDKSDYIWRNPHGVDGMQYDTFTTFVRNGHSILIGLFRYAKSFAVNLRDGVLAGLTEKNNDEQRDLCLGEALELITKTKCQQFRDRFLAVHVLRNKNSPPGSPAIPEDAVEACQWVWQDALMRHDFSPMLLQPRESKQGSNPTREMPSWLTGYSGLDHAEWSLGNQQASPQFTISVEDGLIKTELSLVGKIEKIHYLDAEESGSVAGVEWAIGILGSQAGPEAGTRNLSAAELVDGLNRIFPLGSMDMRHAQQQEGVVYTMEGRENQDRSFRFKVERYLAEYFAVPSQSLQRRYAAYKLTQLLKYDTPIMVNNSAQVTRFGKSRHIAISRRQRGAINGEPICEVRCLESTCRAITLLRLDLRVNAEIGDKVYRIPGLSYSETLQDGMGVVLNKEGRITGRMLYGPPGCPCQPRESVEIH
ncbi:hypothetical protein B0I35DRAFT_440487 [Stachybotrys elegans]|uniref:Heterokaryon incompatibility domain-containing protein n=1 Tax=Stachybotrys elegans TaxID=80388 RepID=A0A8K0WM47_9HYPO|nr:hypothetical protein B0I35DRAFT_440487 [Stachybotrys elegans]